MKRLLCPAAMIKTDIASSIGDGDRITLEYRVSPAGRPASLRGLKPTKSQVHRGFQGQSPPLPTRPIGFPVSFSKSPQR